MRAKRNVVLLVADSLRAKSLAAATNGKLHLPFFARLRTEATEFRRAYAAECWTLPSHCSMFTGKLPSEHGAHFQSMAYTGPFPTAAEALRANGYRTVCVTRNFMFDGTIPGLTRGFDETIRPVATGGRSRLFRLILALSKPRSRRLLRTTGFFHPRHRAQRDFLRAYTQALLPADDYALDEVLRRMEHHRRANEPYFIFANLYDVHWPYPPEARSVLRPFTSAANWIENVAFPVVLTRIGSHAYLRPNFRVSDFTRSTLLARYHRAVELMDGKLATFVDAAKSAGLLDDTVLIITSDHGEAFGEHGLYLHDGSLWNTHLHVPLWIRHPDRAAEAVDDVVTTRDLCGLLSAVGDDRGLAGTIFDREYRAENPIALAEHFYYPQLSGMAPEYRQNIAAAVVPDGKVLLRSGRLERYAVDRDPEELQPEESSLDAFRSACHRSGLRRAAVERAVEHLRGWPSAAEP